MSTRVLMELSLLEAAHLSDLVGQFAELLEEAPAGPDEVGMSHLGGDPALRRLVPDAYTDAEEAAEFRRLTQDDLLARRRADATLVLETLQRDGATLRPAGIDRVDAESPLVVELDSEAVSAWLRTLTALRLVLATRLGVIDDDDRDDAHAADPRFGVYDWLGFRLEGLLQALED